MKYGVESNDAKMFDWKSMASEKAIFQSVDFCPAAAGCGATAGPARAQRVSTRATTSARPHLVQPLLRFPIRGDSSTPSNPSSSFA